MDFLTLILLVCIIATVYTLFFFITDVVCYVGNVMALCSPHTGIKKVPAPDSWPAYFIPFPVAYIVWFFFVR